MNVRKISWQVENLLKKLSLPFEKYISSTNSHYFTLYTNSENCEIRVSDHGQVYGNPTYCIDDTDDGETYSFVKKQLIILAKKEKDWNIANGNI